MTRAEQEEHKRNCEARYIIEHPSYAVRIKDSPHWPESRKADMRKRIVKQREVMKNGKD